jgi:hypothetical protein
MSTTTAPHRQTLYEACIVFLIRHPLLNLPYIRDKQMRALVFGIIPEAQFSPVHCKALCKLFSRSAREDSFVYRFRLAHESRLKLGHEFSFT